MSWGLKMNRNTSSEKRGSVVQTGGWRYAQDLQGPGRESKMWAAEIGHVGAPRALRAS